MFAHYGLVDDAARRRQLRTRGAAAAVPLPAWIEQYEGRGPASRGSRSPLGLSAGICKRMQDIPSREAASEQLGDQYAFSVLQHARPSLAGRGYPVCHPRGVLLQANSRDCGIWARATAAALDVSSQRTSGPCSAMPSKVWDQHGLYKMHRAGHATTRICRQRDYPQGLAKTPGRSSSRGQSKLGARGTPTRHIGLHAWLMAQKPDGLAALVIRRGSRFHSTTSRASDPDNALHRCVGSAVAEAASRYVAENVRRTAWQRVWIDVSEPIERGWFALPLPGYRIEDRRTSPRRRTDAGGERV